MMIESEIPNLAVRHFDLRQSQENRPNLAGVEAMEALEYGANRLNHAIKNSPCKA